MNLENLGELSGQVKDNKWEFLVDLRLEKGGVHFTSYRICLQHRESIEYRLVGEAVVSCGGGSGEN